MPRRRPRLPRTAGTPWPRPLPALLALLLLVPLAACDGGSPSPTQHAVGAKPATHSTTDKASQKKPGVPAGAVAVVNGEPISKAMLDLYRAAREQQQPAGDRADDPAVLNEMVNLVLLAQSARKDGLVDTPKVADRIAFQRTNILAGAMVDKILRGLKISDREIAEAYKRQYKDSPRFEYKTRNIMLHTRADAEQVITDLRRGGDFAQLARKHSIGPAASRGGALQWFKPEDVLTEFAAAVVKLHKGQFTATPVKTRYGWNVILLEDIRKLPVPALKNVKEKIRIDLARKRLDTYLQRLRRHADIVTR